VPAKTPKQERLPKLDYLERLVDAMQARGAVKVTYGDFSVDLMPGFQPSRPESIEPADAQSEARSAIKEAFEKIKRVNETEEQDLYWSAS
jgi:hypothetical protein